MTDPSGKGIVTVFLKDGRTALTFDDAGDYRRLLHGRPGHKPHQGAVAEALEWRWNPETGAYVAVGRVTLRFIDTHTVSWVRQGPPS
jgi:hypothetical protein